MTRPRLTERQNEAYEFVRAYARQRHKPPTLREVADALGLRSLNGVHKLIGALVQKGYLHREPHAARGLEVVDAGDDPYAFDEGVPSLLLVSRTHSAQPAALRRRPQGALSVDPRFLEDAVEDACLVARAGDDGMNGDGVRKGDFLVVEEVPYTDVAQGETVAVLLGDLLVARRYEFANGRLHFRPADRTYAEEAYPPSDPACHVVGRVLAVLRKL